MLDRAELAWAFRLTTAASTSYIVARLVFAHGSTLLAPLTALLVVQLTPVSLLTSGLDRVLSVVAGVVVAIGFASLTGLSWWSLTILIAMSLLVAQTLRIGPNALEVPISAMIVLSAGVAGAESAAWKRIAETLVGAGAGIAVNLVFPPRLAHTDAESAISDLANGLAAMLESASDDLEERIDAGDRLPERIAFWLGEIRRLTHSLPDVGDSLLRAEESRRLNLRAIGTPDVGPGLRSGLEALEHSAIAVRSMVRSIEDAGLSREQQGRADDFVEDLQLIDVSGLFRELASAFGAFAVLLHAEAQRSQTLPQDNILAEGREALAEARARYDQLVLVDRRDDLTFAELTFAVRTAVERAIRELRLDDRIRLLEQSPRIAPSRSRLIRPWPR
jgi:Aromatic acid exporter family member 1